MTIGLVMMCAIFSSNGQNNKDLIIFLIPLISLLLFFIAAFIWKQHTDIFLFFQNVIVVLYICEAALIHGKERDGILIFVVIFIFNENFDKAFLRFLHFFLMYLYFEIRILETTTHIVRLEILFGFLYTIYHSYMIGKALKLEKTISNENKEFISLYEEILKNYPSTLIGFEKSLIKSDFPFDLKFSNDSAKKEFNIIDNPSLSKLLEDVHLNTEDLLNFEAPQEIMSAHIRDQTRRLLDTCVGHEDFFAGEKTSSSIKKFLTTYSSKGLANEAKTVNYRIFLVRFSYKKKFSFLLNLENMSLEEEIIHLKQLDKIKDDTLASITHDLRSPLSSMLKWIEYAKDSNNFEENHRNLELAANNGNMLMSLINDILDYSLIRNGKFKLNYTKFLLESLIQESINLMKIQADFKEISIKIMNKCPKNFFLLSDFTRIKQVIYNLIGNSIKFCRRGGQIDLTFSLISGERNILKILVSDNGVGIKPEIIPKLCEPFHTYDYAGNFNKHGVGLGLHICKTIVGQLGPHNKINIESKYEQGSSFGFVIYINCLLNSPKSKFITSDQLQDYQKQKLEDQILRSSQGFLIEMATSPFKEYESYPSGEFLESLSLKNLPYHKDANPQINLTLFDNITSDNKDTVVESEATGKNANFYQEGEKSKSENENIIISRINSSTGIPRQNGTLHLNIMMADDDPFNQMIMKTIFDRYKFEFAPVKLHIDQVFHGEEAVQMFQTKNFPESTNPLELIFLDCLMPVKDGFKAAQEIKSLMNDDNYIKCEIIGCTSLNDNEKCLLFGMDRILIKPVENIKIFEILNHIFYEKLKIK